MNEKIQDIKQFFDYFSDEIICYDYIAQRRWAGNITCVECGSTRIYKYRDEKTYKCGDCQKRFNVLKGTIFEASKIPIRSWFIAIYLHTAHKVSVSALQMSRHLNITAKSAWFMHHRVMEALKVELETMKPLPGIWEIDEVYIGPKKEKLSRKKLAKIKQGTGFIHMTPILAFFRRGDCLFGQIIPDSADRYVVQPIVKKYIDSMATIMTDGSGVYHGLGNYFLQHNIFIHKDGNYGSGTEHSNTIEGCFKHFKDSIRGSHKQLTRRYMQRYWDAFCFRYNNKDLTDMERFEKVFDTICRRLTLKNLKLQSPKP